MRAFVFALLVSSAAVTSAALAQPAQPPGPQGAPQQAPPAGGPDAPAASPAGWKEHFDELWMVRDHPGTEKQLHEILKHELTAKPDDFEANWRLAELLNWQANGTSGDLKAALGKAAWAAADKAIQARPDDVRGHYNSGVGVGLYSEGVGILTALSQGLEGKFRDRMQAALRIDKDYLDGAPQVVWGRYFYKLPWPKRDVKKSIEVLSAAVREHPANFRAKLYLADSLADQDQTAEAKKLVQAVIDAKVGPDAPEDRRLKKMAQEWMSQH